MSCVDAADTVGLSVVVVFISTAGRAKGEIVDMKVYRGESTVIVPDFTISLSLAVHVIISFSASFLLICFLFLLVWDPGWMRCQVKD